MREEQNTPYLLGRLVAIAKDAQDASDASERWSYTKYLDLFAQGVLAAPLGELSGFFRRDLLGVQEERRARLEAAATEVFSLMDADLPVKADWACKEAGDVYLGYYHQCYDLSVKA